MPVSVGQKLGPYEIVAPIGAGGMGEVWKARDTRLDRTVALKVSKVEFTERFEREARAVAALNHPHICTLHDVGPNYLVMEYVEGAPLKGPLRVEKAAEYGGQILDALDAAHKKGIVHRDLKPANILLTKQGVKLLDFGLAKRAEPLKETDATRTEPVTGAGQIVGTLQYMPPEQLQGKETDARSDLFSFGCVLYEMLTGRRAFQGENAASVIAAILEREPEPLNISPPLDRVVKRCLAKDPDERFQTARDLNYNLALALESPAPAVAAKSNRWWIAVAAGALALAVATYWLGRESKPPADRAVRRYSFGDGATEAAISPNGRMVAYILNRQLWIRDLDRLEPRLLVGGDQAVGGIFWSPDSDQIAFIQERYLRKVSAKGGAVATISTQEIRQSEGAWRRDGTILLADGLNAYEVPGAGGTMRPIKERKSWNAYHVHNPFLLPGSQAFLASVHDERTDNTALVKIEGTRVTKLIAEPGGGPTDLTASPPGHLIWQDHGPTLWRVPFDLTTGQLRGTPVRWIESAALPRTSATGSLSYLRSSPATSIPVVFDRKGSVLKRIEGEPAQLIQPSISPDGTRLAVAEEGLSKSIWVYDLARGGRSRAARSNDALGHPRWSPQSDRIVYMEGYNTGAGGRALLMTQADGTGTPKHIVKENVSITLGDWSRNGEYLVYSKRAADSLAIDLWLVPLNSDPAPARMFAPGIASDVHISPDSKFIAYSSRESGRSEIYVKPFPQGESRWNVSVDGGLRPRWNPRGGELFYVRANALYSVHVDTSNGFTASAPVKLFDLGGDRILSAFGNYDVFPDGQRFLFLQEVKPRESSVVVVENWAEELATTPNSTSGR